MDGEIFPIDGDAPAVQATTFFHPLHWCIATFFHSFAVATWNKTFINVRTRRCLLLPITVNCVGHGNTKQVTKVSLCSSNILQFAILLGIWLVYWHATHSYFIDLIGRQRRFAARISGEVISNADVVAYWYRMPTWIHLSELKFLCCAFIPTTTLWIGNRYANLLDTVDSINYTYHFDSWTRIKSFLAVLHS